MARETRIRRRASLLSSFTVRLPSDNSFAKSNMLLGYVPSLVLGIVALVCFGLLLGAHLFLLVRHRAARTFQALLAFGCAMEVVGYGFRLASHYKPFKVINFIIQYFMIVCVRTDTAHPKRPLIFSFRRHPFSSLPQSTLPLLPSFGTLQTLARTARFHRVPLSPVGQILPNFC